MNTNTEQWGNIELPGLSDDKLFNTNWHQTAINRKNGKTKEHSLKSTKNNIETWANPEVRQRRLDGLKIANQKQEVREKKTQANIRNAQKPEVRAKNLKNIMSRARPVIDDKGTVFESLTDCARKYNLAVGTIQYYIKKNKFRYC